MVQAARSGRQNIAEGSRAASTSSPTELRLVNVARSSLAELLLDYEDYLRHRRLKRWKPDRTLLRRGLFRDSGGIFLHHTFERGFLPRSQGFALFVLP